MGKLQVFEVLLAGNQEVYKPGDVVKGVARIVLSEEKRDIRGIQIKYVGKSYTHWKESEGSGVNQITSQYTTNHEYFRQEITLRSAGNDNSAADRITLTAGEHRFTFQFQIPNMTLPPPFEDAYGHVRYYVKVTIDRPGRFDHHTKKIFSIFTVKDLNYELNVLVPPTNQAEKTAPCLYYASRPNVPKRFINKRGYAKVPASHQVEKTVCCLCCASGPIVLKGMIDKRGYVPGEYIFVSLNLHNNSSCRIINITAKLQQSGHFTAQCHDTGKTHHRQSVKTVAELKLAGCEAMGSVNYDRVKMLIPPIPSCAYENCPNIQVEYFVEIKGDVSGTHKDAQVNLPIVIGTIPAFQHTLKDPLQNPYAVQSIPGQLWAPPGGQPGFPSQGQHGYPPQGQQGYPPPEQPGAPPSGQEYPPPGQPGAPPPGQQGYPPQGQQGYPPPGQPEVPPPEQGYPPTYQPGALPPRQQGYPPQGQQGYPSPGQPGAPPPGRGYPPPGQPGALPPRQQGYPPQGQQGYPPPGQPRAPPPGQGYPPPGQPGAPPPGQQGYPPQGQQGYPPPGQPKAPPPEQGYPPPGQPRTPPPRQQRYPPPRHPGLPPPGAGPSGCPPLGGISGEEAAGLPPPPTCRAAVGGPQKVPGEKGTFGKILYAPQYPYYDPGTLYASMGIPLGATASSADGGQPPPTVVQPMSIQQLPRPPDLISQSEFSDHPTRPNDAIQLVGIQQPSYKSFLENGHLVTVL